MSQQLSKLLFREVRPDFFRVLSGPYAPVYVDALDELERAAAQRNQGLEREEALALVEQTIEQHQLAALAEGDEMLATAATPREKARVLLEALRQSGWVEEEQRSNWQRLVFFNSSGAVLLQALRKMAMPELAVFSDKVVSVCATLAHQDGLSESPLPQVESSIELLRAGLAELRGMQKSIERYTRQQLSGTTLKENLEVLFDHFAERVGRTCYAELVHARLPSKLAEARRAADWLLGDASILAKMQAELLHRDRSIAPEAAMARARLRLDELAELLHQVEPLADAIDRRTAEFARRSQARFRYLQETTSENRSRVQEFFESLNHHFAGKRLASLEDRGTEFPGLRLHELRLMGGLESLFTPRLRRAAAEIEPLEESTMDETHQDRALAQLEGNLRDSLTVNRANRFVSELPGKPGARFGSSDLLRDFIHNDEDVADLLACLLHARSTDARFRLELDREVQSTDTSEFDRKLNYRIERFSLVKK